MYNSDNEYMKTTSIVIIMIHCPMTLYTTINTLCLLVSDLKPSPLQSTRPDYNSNLQTKGSDSLQKIEE